MLIKNATNLKIKDVLSKSTGLQKSGKCRVQFISFNVTQGLWRFKSSCSEKYSKSGGWEVNIWLEKDVNTPPANLEFTATCNCPAWVYWGSDYHAKNKKYLLGRPKSNGAAPRVRDPRGENLVCKHVYLCLYQMMRGRRFV